MESHSFSSFPDSANSSPRSREVDADNSSSWDDQQPPPPAGQTGGCRVRFMCSYGGKIQPRPHDNQLAYVGGDTKILGVDQNIKFSALMAKLSAISDSLDVCLKYQLPGEDLDALISVTNDEDLEHMMVEYDRLLKAAAKPARLRLFLFPLSPQNSSTFVDAKPEGQRQQWFVDVLNSAQLQSLDDSSPPAAVPPPPTANPDFLFGLDKGMQTAPEVFCRQDVDFGSDDQMLSQAEIQRQIQELQRMQIANPALQRRLDETNARALAGESYSQQQAMEKIAAAAPAPVPVQMQVQQMPGGYMHERHLPGGGGSYAVSGNEQPVYYIPTSYRTITGPPVGQAFYGVQHRAVPQDVYREQVMYTTAASSQPPMTEGIQVQVGYEASGRQVYYTMAPGGVGSAYQAGTIMAMDGKQGGGIPNQEASKVAPPPSQTSAV